jgi:glycosyltransferase involved in cell wall biosynthesis
VDQAGSNLLPVDDGWSRARHNGRVTASEVVGCRAAEASATPRKQVSQGGVTDLFSVLIPLYNKGHTIVDTLQSVLAQTFEDFEVVIVDDGSTDDGPANVEQFFDDPRIRLIHQQNSGEGSARNAGIDAARYDWIAFLDADDIWLPGYLSEIYGAIQEFPDAGMICCGGVSRNPDGSGQVRQSEYCSVNRQKVEYFECPPFFGNSSSTVVAKRLVPITGNFPVAMPHFADITFFCKFALKTNVIFCPALLMIVNSGVPGQISSDRRSNTAGIVESSNLIFSFWDSLQSDEQNPMCIRFIMQTLRAGFRYSLSHSDYDLLHYFLNNTDPRLLQRLTFTEKFLYQRPRLRLIALMRSRASGLRRRISHYPSPRFSIDVMKVIVDSA